MDTTPNEPWTFGVEVASHIRTFLNLRETLRRKVYELLGVLARWGYPVVPPVIRALLEDSASWNATDAFLTATESS